MTSNAHYQLSEKAARTFAHQKVPAIFAPMAEATLDAISLPKRADVLDVACGTGAVVRAVAARMVEPSRIVGLDINPTMINLAHIDTPANLHEIEWVVSSAESLPFNDANFSLVFCQQGLQFFSDRSAALTEMRRVLGPGGRLILSCWAAIPPFFEVIAKVLRNHLDEIAAARTIAPFSLNNGREICDLISNAGFDCPSPAPLTIMRRMSAKPNAMREEILASRNESILRAAGNAAIDDIVNEILEGVALYRKGEFLIMPQQAHLFEAIEA